MQLQLHPHPPLIDPPPLKTIDRRAHQEEKGFSDMTIIGGALLVPLMIGGTLICLLDALYTRQPDFHQHYE
jgi:hypothetical protein